jgi:site-specific DNA-methyltransferase (adenine-specific)
MNEEQIVYIEVNKLKLNEKNPRKNDNAVDGVAKSIEKYGFKNPLIVDSNNVVWCGNTRLKASKKLGLKKVPCIVADDLTEEQIREYALLDNKLNEIAEWDYELLGDELLELDLSDFELDWGLPEFVEEKEVEEDDFDCTPPEEPKAKLGDIYKLGNHRLMCGDSTKEEDVAKLMDGNKADMVFTDPPYNLETTGGCKGEIGKALKKQGNDIEFISDFNPTEFLKVMPSFFDKNKLNSYIFCNKELLPTYLNWAVENKYSFNVLVWKKPNAIPIGDSHRPDIEYILLFRKNAIWNNGLKDVNYSRCLEFSRETGLHPTMKPIKLITNELEISSNKNSNILDFFGGSGSTLIACEQLNRNCYMMELDCKYVDVIIARWEQFTGKKAEKIN